MRADSNKSAAERGVGPDPLLSVPAIVRMFDHARPRLIELLPIQRISAQIASSCSTVLRELAALEQPFSVVCLDQDLDKQRQDSHLIAAQVAVPEWHDILLISIDRLLLFRSLDTIFGGNARLRTSAPDRELTRLEQALASNLARLLAHEIQKALAPVCSFTLQAPQLLASDGRCQVRAGEGRFTLELAIAAAPVSIRVSCPLEPLERVRELATLEERAEALDLDPSWSQDFRCAVGAAAITLIAIADGPHLLLSDIAGLQPGTLLELDPDALRSVRIQSSEWPVFLGRLGQSAGLFTVCIEAPASSAAGAGEQLQRPVSADER